MPRRNGPPVVPHQLTPSADYTVQDQRRMQTARKYFSWQYRLAQSALGRRVLEVGCGLGNFSELLTQRELLVAVDVEPACVRALTEHLGACSNVVVKAMDVADPEFPGLVRHGVDSVVCLNVLEHVQDDRLALANMGAVVPVGGKVVLIVPAFQALYGPIDAKLGHYRRYTKRSLAELAFSQGFEVSVLRYLNFVGFFGWWFNARVTKRTAQSAFQIALFDSLIVPLLSRIEGLIEPPCGQSIFAVLVKRR